MRERRGSVGWLGFGAVSRDFGAESGSFLSVPPAVVEAVAVGSRFWGKTPGFW